MTKDEWMLMRSLFFAVFTFLQWIATRLLNQGMKREPSLEEIQALEKLTKSANNLIELTEDMEVEDVEQPKK